MDKLGSTGSRQGLVAFSVVASLLQSCGSNSGGGMTGSPTPALPVPTAPAPTPLPAPNPLPPSANPLAPQAMVASNWEIGPVITGVDYSAGMPLSPTQTADGWAFDFPLSPGSVHYVTFRHGSLAGKTHIVMRYRIEAEPGVKLIPVCCADLPSLGPTLYFQHKADDWNTDGMRWWATFKTPVAIEPGEYELDVPLTGKWTSVFTMDAELNAKEFQDAKLNADRVGFTFGGGDGYGHGVYANGPARFVLTSFKVE